VADTDPFDALALGIAKKYELPADAFLHLAKKQRQVEPEPQAVSPQLDVQPQVPRSAVPKVELPDFGPDPSGVPEAPRVSLASRVLAGEFAVNTPEGRPGRQPPRAQRGATRVPGAPVTPGVLPSKPVKIGRFVAPLSTRMSSGSEFAVSDAEGAPSTNGGRYHAGKDWFAPARAAVRSPWAGRVVEVRASRGNSGQVFGGTVKIQRADGVVFVARHVDPRRVRVGQRIGRGQVVAGVSPWTGGSPHAHIEVWRTLGGGYRFENMIDPATVFGGRR
jgi:murein DD-endopeptidase MepM/ murein hydrolase activator NlpD